MDRQENDRNLGPAPPHQRCRFESADSWHRDVDHEDVGTKIGLRVDQRFTVAEGRHHIEFRGQKRRDAHLHLAMIVGEYHSRPAAIVAAFGTHESTSRSR